MTSLHPARSLTPDVTQLLRRGATPCALVGCLSLMLVACASKTRGDATATPATPSSADVVSTAPPVNSPTSPAMNPADVVQAQLEAYNRRDLPAFLATFHEQAELFTLGESAPSATGRAELERLYGDLFAASPTLHSELVHRGVIGSRVIDHERITGRRGSSEPLELVMVYEVDGGLIRRAWAIRP